MNVSATRLVYVNKKSAKIQNAETGDFINEVPNGVPVEEGDLISVEGIAVESRGVGSSIIEIPSRELNYKYLTNRMVMKMWYYLHHNFSKTVMLPVSSQTFKSAPIGSEGYGYSFDVGFEATNNATYQPKNNFTNRVYAGSRFYVGCFDDNPQRPFAFNTRNDANNRTPSNSNFNFIECNREVGVSLGYDSPANIANKITSDLHKGRFAPNTVLFGDNGKPTQTPQKLVGNNFLSPTPAIRSTITSATGDINECVITMRSVPYCYENFQSPFIEGYYSLYQGYLAVLNPLYWYYGSRLLNKNEAIKHNVLFLAGGVNEGDIYNMNELQNDGTNTQIVEGELLITNLNFDKKNLENLRGLIHSQKKFVDTSEAKITTDQLRTPENKNKFFWDIPMGRYDDSNASPFSNNAPLTQGSIGANTVAPTYLTTKVFYNKEFYEGAGYYATSGTGFGFAFLPAPEYTVDFDGVALNAKAISQLLDINVYCLKSPQNPLAPPPITQFDYYICIPLGAQTVQNTIFTQGNYAVCDLTFSRPEATACLVASWEQAFYTGTKPSPTYENIMRCMSIGSPDFTLEFDDQRGRFAFKNMYWAKRIGNDIDAGSDNNPLNPDPEQEIIVSNKKASERYVATGEIILYTDMALSGLGLVDLAVLDEQGNQYVIDKNDPQDIIDKYNGSLFDRLGFTYEGLINPYGKSEVVFQEQFYNTDEPTQFATYFPYPLTNNPEIDTTFNQYINTNNYKAPMFNLNTQRDVVDINIASSTSFIYAENLPKKLASPYWIIGSDIIDGVKFQKDGQPINCLAVCNRSYISGDFAFSFATSYKFKADIPFTISSIKTKVLTQDLLPADIDEGTSIIYKIEKQYKREIEEEQEEQKQQTK